MVLLTALFVLATTGAAATTQDTSYDIVVQTSQGLIGGAKTSLGFKFNAVRFADPPLGDLRFAPPQNTTPWGGVYNSSVGTYACPQLAGLGPSNGPTSEDCLFMTIYVPSSFGYNNNNNNSAYRDVAVFWHGGAFHVGSQYNLIGDYLANNTDKVVVVAQYRLGILGLLGHQESGTYGNYAIMDQQLTLLWVRQNIGSFGGNASSVTIEGQSAGAISVAIHAVAPASRGLYHRAFAHSGVGYSGSLLNPKSWITDTMWQVISELGCTANNTCTNATVPLSLDCSAFIRSCLRNASVDSILNVQAGLAQFVKPRPAVDGIVIPAQPIDLIEEGLFYRVPTIFSSMNNESTALLQTKYPFNSTRSDFNTYVTATFGEEYISSFAQLYPVNVYGGFDTYYAAMAKIDTDYYYGCPTLNWLDALQSAGHRQVYFMHFDYYATWQNAYPNAFPTYYGAWHAEDIIYLSQQGCVLESVIPWCNFFTPSAAPDDWPLVATYQSFWASFLATGEPNITSWIPYTNPSQNPGRTYLRIQSPTSWAITDATPEQERCAFIDSFLSSASSGVRVEMSWLFKQLWQLIFSEVLSFARR